MTARGQKKLRWLTVNFCRLLLSATFLFSGVVKLIDPRGTQYKIEDYAALWDLSAFVPHLAPLVLAVALAIVEFYVGFNLFFGIRRRTTTRLALLLMVVMTPLTLYLAWADVQMDCGCFGDAVHLTNWQTFGKNLILLLASLVVVRYYRMLTRFITERNQWLLSLYALVFSLFLAIRCVHYLPVMDFRPYRIGTDLPKAMEAEWESMDGEMRYADFSIQTLNGEDVTFEWLQKPGYKFLLVSPYLELANDDAMDCVNTLYDYCRRQGYPFLALTSSTEEAIDRWKDITGAEYEFAQTDGTTLKTVIRSNPGLLLLHGGTIFQKWSCNNLPQVEELTAPLEQTPLGQMQVQSKWHTAYRLLLWFVIPLLLWTLIDRVWVGSKYYKRHKIRKRIFNNKEKVLKQEL